MGFFSKLIRLIREAATEDKPSNVKEQQAGYNKYVKQENKGDNRNYYSSKKPRNTQQPEHMKYSKRRKLQSDYVVLDFETTGLSPFDSQIIQIGAIKYDNHEFVDQYTTYVNPLTKISSKITKITGITDKHVESAPLIQDVLPKLIDFIEEYPLVAHNAPYDMKFLLHNMYTHSIPYKQFKVFDTLPLARKHIQTENHKLVTLKDYLKLNQYKSHSALDDCFVTGELYKYCFVQDKNKPEPKPSKQKGKFRSVRISDIKPETESFDPNHKLFGLNVALTGDLSSISRRDAMQKVVNIGANIRSTVSKNTNILVVGKQDTSVVGSTGKSSKERKAEELVEQGHSIQVINENEFIELLTGNDANAKTNSEKINQ